MWYSNLIKWFVHPCGWLEICPPLMWVVVDAYGGWLLMHMVLVEAKLTYSSLGQRIM
ncbi:hypothetical protein LguiB_023818 [Lonicera macranthoides]